MGTAASVQAIDPLQLGDLPGAKDRKLMTVDCDFLKETLSNEEFAKVKALEGTFMSTGRSHAWIRVIFFKSCRKSTSCRPDTSRLSSDRVLSAALVFVSLPCLNQPSDPVHPASEICTLAVHWCIFSKPISCTLTLSSSRLYIPYI
jgi:hypothetical protein